MSCLSARVGLLNHGAPSLLHPVAALVQHLVVRVVDAQRGLRRARVEFASRAGSFGSIHGVDYPTASQAPHCFDDAFLPCGRCEQDSKRRLGNALLVSIAGSSFCTGGVQNTGGALK
jgi:hypothetical protein